MIGNQAAEAKPKNGDYPSDRAGKGHAVRFGKALFESNAIAQAGRDAVLLAIFIAFTEDRLFYRTAPRFWRAELMQRFGIRSAKDLIRIRGRAVDAGILTYIEGSRAVAPEYWSAVPDWLTPFMGSQKGTDESSTRSLSRSQLRSRKGTESGTESGALSYTRTKTPTPTPKGVGGKGISIPKALEAAP